MVGRHTGLPFCVAAKVVCRNSIVTCESSGGGISARRLYSELTRTQVGRRDVGPLERKLKPEHELCGDGIREMTRTE
jgi:hypothetical protein